MPQAVPIIATMVISTVVSKAVTKITGSEILGTIAGIATGFGIGSAASAAGNTVGGGSAGATSNAVSTGEALSEIGKAGVANSGGANAITSMTNNANLLTPTGLANAPAISSGTSGTVLNSTMPSSLAIETASNVVAPVAETAASSGNWFSNTVDGFSDFVSEGVDGLSNMVSGGSSESMKGDLFGGLFGGGKEGAGGLLNSKMGGYMLMGGANAYMKNEELKALEEEQERKRQQWRDLGTHYADELVAQGHPMAGVNSQPSQQNMNTNQQLAQQQQVANNQAPALSQGRVQTPQQMMEQQRQNRLKHGVGILSRNYA